ncbi:hnRNP A1-gamma isoform [Coprinopsis cinerea okayama7|uniref:HnRNP A1-gamma isoform n=1 Tax=Coprinopsis cinerea (strain Okayama-7 / 130 / ATCC MYA-4618 / FGSC 9003) TaxID=240176 RepID=A8NJH6_COPC7|nr:hnRNP A1-gamma isoform [Coprinopsis cinerea okayama7\|eukprot:XP_001834228.2 hnRNP A1-gamma isoform [Coprinopsis cinerea okayama7\
MSKPSLDSDLYGDIYGDELQDFLDDDGTANDATEQTSTEPQDASDDANRSASPQQAMDTSSSDNTQPGQLSYSAQIAQQFSAYKQTPSQERQQRAAQRPIPRVDSSTPAASSSDSIFGKKPSEMHDAGDYFEQFGKVDACTIMRDPNTGTSRGFAFLTFEDPNCVDLVLKQSHSLDGKAIDPKRAIPREEHLRNTRFFVGGLAHSTTSESMKAFFSSYGKVVDATVMMDKETGRSKGFGFVTFEDVGTSLNHIVGKIGLVLDDKEIEIRLAQARNQRDQTRNLVNKITSDRGSTPDRSSTTPSPALSLPALNLAQMGPMAAMLFNRSMGNLGAMNMANMNNNPMSIPNTPMNNMGMPMNMSMNNMNPAAGGAMPLNVMAAMNPMMLASLNMANLASGNASGGNSNSAGAPIQNPLNAMAGMNMMLMNGLNPTMRMGMGGMIPGMAGAAGMQQGMAGMMNNSGRGKPGGMQPNGLGPARTHGAMRKQQGFHPYSR